MTDFYVVVNANNMPTAFYSDDIFPPNADGSLNAAIPAGAVPLTEAQWLDCINNPGWRQIVNGAPVAYTPPAPAPVPVQLTLTQFVALFTPAEQQAIAATNDAQAKIYLFQAAGASALRMNDPLVVAGLNYFVALGLLTQVRVTAILATPAPAT